MTINYSMTPIGNGTRLRKDHTTFAVVITSYNKGDLVQGDEIWVASAEGKEVWKNDKWLHVTHVNNAPLEEQGWMALIHKGIKICDNFTDLTGGTPPPPPTEKKLVKIIAVWDDQTEEVFYEAT